MNIEVSQRIQDDDGGGICRVSIEPLADLPSSGVPFEDYHQRFKQLEATKFILSHKTDETKDICIEMQLDVEARKVEWDGLPRVLTMLIAQDYDLCTDHPLEMLNMALQELIDENRGMRPYTEIKDLISQSIEIKRAHPNDCYEWIREIGQGGFGKVFLLSRKRDSKLFAMKQIRNVQKRDLNLVVNEASLISYLNHNCNELIRCEDLYYYD